MIFRYPGGKSRFTGLILDRIPKSLTRFHDVCVGGGSVMVAVAQAFPSAEIVANDLDPYLFSFWQFIAESTPRERQTLCDLLAATPTIELFKTLRENTPTSRVDRAYHAIFFNRTTFSGMATSGPIGGWSHGSSYAIDCRWNTRQLVQDLQALHWLLRGRLTVTRRDMSDYMRTVRGGFFYIDPPYMLKEQTLYRQKVTPDEHRRLAQTLKTRTGKGWLLSYNACEEVKTLYRWADVEKINLRYSMTGTKRNGWPTGTEFFVTPR